MTSNDSQESSAIPAMESASETVRRIFGNDGSSLGAEIADEACMPHCSPCHREPDAWPSPTRKAASARRQQR